MADTEELEIKGMRCNGCVQSISRALAECAGVESVAVSLDRGTAAVQGAGLDRPALVAAVEGLGFEVLNR